MSGETKNEEQPQKTNSQKLDVPINEFYQLIQNEYACERERKQSIETRSGIILTVSMAFFAFVFEKVSLRTIVALFGDVLTFSLLINIITGLAIYIFYFLSVFFSVLSLKSNEYAFYNVGNITTARLMSDRISTFGQLILDFVEIVKTNRQVNSKKVKYFNLSILCLIICMICLCIFININRS